MTARPLIIGLIMSLILSGIFFSGCKKNNPITDPSAQLTFELDTLLFDTVFTTQGSATRSFKVYNPHDQPIVIDNIYLGGGANSYFRLNIDGFNGNMVSDIEVAPNDSLYVFAEVTIDPGMTNNPFIVLDSVRFETNGNEQDVFLEAWGQDAIYVGQKAGIGLLSCAGGTEIWDDPRPYVVSGILVIDTCALEIAAGTEIYVHGGLVNEPDLLYNDGIIFVGSEGSIIINGTASEPVVISADRIEPEFENLPGQFAGVFLGPGSQNNRMNYVEIESSIVGLRVDSAADLRITNSMIHNTSSSALLAVHADIVAENCMFYNSSAKNSVQVEYGGDYTFNYCTIGGYPSRYISHGGPALRMSNYICYQQDIVCLLFGENTLNATFSNSIIYGTKGDEIQLDELNEDSGLFNYEFNNCLIKRNELDISTGFNNCLFNEDPGFLDTYELDYHLDTLSPAENFAVPLNSAIAPFGLITTDIEGNMRDGSTPDCGAYEYQY